MIALTLEQLLELHALVISETGGADGLRELGRLESAIAAQTQAVFGEELYPTAYEKAAALIRGLIADHPFVDGNKRTAILAGLTFLELNGIKFDAEAGQLDDFAVRVATRKPNISHITNWLQTHSKN